MPEPRVENFFQPMKLEPPQIAHFIETNIHVRTQIGESRIIDQNAHQDGEHDRHGGQSDREQLRIAHSFLFYRW